MICIAIAQLDLDAYESVTDHCNMIGMQLQDKSGYIYMKPDLLSLPQVRPRQTVPVPMFHTSCIPTIPMLHKYNFYAFQHFVCTI